LPGENKENY